MGLETEEEQGDRTLTTTWPTSSLPPHNALAHPHLRMSSSMPGSARAFGAASQRAQAGSRRPTRCETGSQTPPRRLHARGGRRLRCSSSSSSTRGEERRRSSRAASSGAGVQRAVRTGTEEREGAVADLAPCAPRRALEGPGIDREHGPVFACTSCEGSERGQNTRPQHLLSVNSVQQLDVLSRCAHALLHRYTGDCSSSAPPGSIKGQ